MPEGDSPTVARRRVRLALREAREKADLTQLQVADEMEWSLSKVIRIENGDVSISPNDLRPLLAFLGIRDRPTVAALIGDARIARTRQRQAWFQLPEFRENLTDATRKLIEYEHEAAQMRSYSVYYIPGPLQTPDYARALMTRFEDELSDAQMSRRIEARKLRRESLLTRAQSGQVRIAVMLDESVLRRTIGGATVFAAQLRELRRLIDAGTITMRMVPFSLDAAVTNNASFDLLVLGEGEVLYRETGLSDEMIEDRDVTAKHRARWNKVWDEVADEAATLAFIDRQIKILENPIEAYGRQPPLPD
ncbi:DNA-binding protein [Actinoplanes sp. SE50]|uniref:helix-turn-helix domain-containing protein n=1 Tax=unclassified Actinoplanes TaxID=2626549 RepID=UPI00023EC565|nr:MULTISPECIES: helix-turn-helix transcriptional regulator [unclassified Actinoplanes]AEV81415.1 helix-turn-helix domain-containing protein [Actinoplanes sp. SE50/110]ATO79818.1 DNA-binding protein [Actinoplanes sp. SE50]SLL97220.1 transcriptional regulator [Actinoplanes sp. SE50/110]